MCYEDGVCWPSRGEVTAEEHAEIATHVADCTECRDTLARLEADRAVRRGLDRLHEPGKIVAMPTPAQRRDASAARRTSTNWSESLPLPRCACTRLARFRTGSRRRRQPAQVFRVQKVQTVTLSQSDSRASAPL